MNIKRDPSNILVMILLSAILCACLSSCGYAYKNMIKPVNNLPLLKNQEEQKPIVYLKYKKFWKRSATENIEFSVSQQENEYIYDLLNDSGLFAEVIYDEYEKKRADFTIEMSLYEYSENQGASIVGAVITGLTLFLIPSATDVSYSLNTKIIDQTGKVIHEYKNTDGKTFWIGLLALFIIDYKDNNILTNQINDSLKNIDTESVFSLNK